ncbi:MAG: nucleotidyltransferase domain-containing protein [Thermoleophilaceae bacterium]
MVLRERIGDDAADYVEAVAGRVVDRLGDDVVGIWLVGSAALGDFSAQRSDIDIQAVTAEPLAAERLAELAAALEHHSLPVPARGLEFVLYTRAGLADPAGPAFQLNLNTGARMEHHLATDPDADPRFWFVIDLSIARQSAITLRGAAPAEVLLDLPRPMVCEAVRQALDWYVDNHGRSAETALSACRSWAFAVDGVWRSKTDAARWAGVRAADEADVDRLLAEARNALRDCAPRGAA